MKIKSIALALAVAASGLVAGQSFAQDRDVTITHGTPDGGVVTKHIVRSDDGPAGPVVHRVTRIQRPDGSTVVRRTTRVGDFDGMRPHRTVVIHRRYEPARHVVVRTIDGRPGYVVNRRVTVIHNEG